MDWRPLRFCSQTDPPVSPNGGNSNRRSRSRARPVYARLAGPHGDQRRWQKLQARQRASAADFRLSSHFPHRDPRRRVPAERRLRAGRDYAYGRGRRTPAGALAGQRLDAGFWRSLREHPVPVREEAVRAIGARSLALDVYVWLAYRLHSLTRPTPVTWTALHGQFGAGFKAIRQLKPTFRDALTLALAVYPEARVDLEGNGLVLHPSPPAVPRAEAKRIGLG